METSYLVGSCGKRGGRSLPMAPSWTPTPHLIHAHIGQISLDHPFDGYWEFPTWDKWNTSYLAQHSYFFLLSPFSINQLSYSHNSELKFTYKPIPTNKTWILTTNKTRSRRDQLPFNSNTICHFKVKSAAEIFKSYDFFLGGYLQVQIPDNIFNSTSKSPDTEHKIWINAKIPESNLI